MKRRGFTGTLTGTMLAVFWARFWLRLYSRRHAIRWQSRRWIFASIRPAAQRR